MLDFCFHDLTTYKSPFLTDQWQEYTGLMLETAESFAVSFGQAHANVYDFLNPRADHEYQKMVLKRCVLASEQMKIPWLVIHPSTDFGAAAVYKESRVKNIAFLSGLAEFAEKHQVGIAVENMWDLHIAPKRYYGNNAEELVDLVDAVGGSSVGICWDLEHASIMEQDQKKAMK